MKSNYKFGEVIALKEQIEVSAEKVQSRQVFETAGGGVVLLGFKEGQKLETHLSPAEVMVNVVEGEIEFTMNGIAHTIKENEFLLIGGGVPHSVMAKKDSKVMLVKIKADNGTSL